MNIDKIRITQQSVAGGFLFAPSEIEREIKVR